MVKIAVFDSGLGSLSIIKSIQQEVKAEIIYFADRENFPYGKKTRSQLYRIISRTIQLLKNKFSPDLIVVGSNTPTLLLEKIFTSKIIGVFPPLKDAIKISKTNNIAILTTYSVAKSKELEKYIRKNKSSKKVNIHRINASPLIELVESGKFLTNKQLCKKIVKNYLNDFTQNDIDVATLSSTHLPFLKSYLQEAFPSITFLDPAYTIAKRIARLTKNKRSNKNSLKIFTSGNVQNFQKQLRKIGINNKVNFSSLS